MLLLFTQILLLIVGAIAIDMALDALYNSKYILGVAALATGAGAITFGVSGWIL